MITGAVLLMTGCSAEDVTREVTPRDAVAISFSCNQEEEITRGAHQGAMNIEDLYATGFGVFASVSAEKKPDLMYNQEVAFTFVGDMDNPLKGYWSYYPVKYWPVSITNLFISAYAPYVELPIANPETTTGIYGISANTATPYVEYRRCEKPESMVDLLWYFEDIDTIPEPSGRQKGTLNMKMRHALARLAINVALATPPTSGTKVLIDSIALTGKMAKTGRLSLSSQKTDTVIENEKEIVKYYPVWSEQTYDEDEGGEINHTIIIDNDDNNAESYGIIDSQVRYIEGLPYAWQPAGLTTTAQNALSTGDRQTYIYLIPQENWSVTVQVDYKTWGSGAAEPTSGTKTVTTQANLKGNTPYVLNITLSGI